MQHFIEVLERRRIEELKFSNTKNNECLKKKVNYANLIIVLDIIILNYHFVSSKYVNLQKVIEAQNHI